LITDPFLDTVYQNEIYRTITAEVLCLHGTCTKVLSLSWIAPNNADAVRRKGRHTLAS